MYVRVILPKIDTKLANKWKTFILQEACEDPPAYREAKKRVHEEQRRKEIAEAERVENEVHLKN